MTQIIQAVLVKIAFVFVAYLTLAGTATAGPLEDAEAGFNAQNSGDYETALKMYESAAAGGVAYAMHNLGTMHYNGNGVKRSWVEAMKWYKQAAEDGFVDSQHVMGGMYERGEGVHADAGEAVKWYEMAANQGHAPAQNALGILYTTGGKNLQPNLVRAHLWFNIASREDPRAASRKDRTAPRMTPEQNSEAEALAKAWKPK
ncbi:MAG: tetratricopeptide repeat protein [Rhodospirillaceae bacterium]